MCNFALQQFASSSGRALFFPRSLAQTAVKSSQICLLPLLLPPPRQPRAFASRVLESQTFPPSFNCEVVRSHPARFKGGSASVTSHIRLPCCTSTWKPSVLAAGRCGRPHRRTAAAASPSALVYSADLQDDRTGLFGADPQSGPGSAVAGRSPLPEPIKIQACGRTAPTGSFRGASCRP